MTDTKVSTLDPDLSGQLPPEQVADAYADRLMDEIFDGVERALEGDLEALDAAPAPQTNTDNAPEATVSFTDGSLPSVLLTSPVPSGESDIVPIATELATNGSAQDAPSSDSATPSRRNYAWTIRRAAIGAAGLLVLAALGVWLRQRQQVATVAEAPASAPTEVPVAGGDVEFLEYLRRSLEVTAQNAAGATPATADVPNVSVALNNGTGLPPIANSTLPPQPGPNPNGVPGIPGQINVIERVYVPYPTAQAPAPVAGSPTVNPPTVASGAPASTAPAPPAAPAPMHKLVGVLELGDRSAALFEIDGSTQRVYIGERIGSGGWSLVSVANEEAVVRRNGEVRTLYIGQQF